MLLLLVDDFHRGEVNNIGGVFIPSIHRVEDDDVARKASRETNGILCMQLEKMWLVGHE